VLAVRRVTGSSYAPTKVLTRFTACSKALDPCTECIASSVENEANGAKQLGLCLLLQQSCTRAGALFLIL